MGVITRLITSRGPPCSDPRPFLISCILGQVFRVFFVAPEKVFGALGSNKMGFITPIKWPRSGAVPLVALGMFPLFPILNGPSKGSQEGGDGSHQAGEYMGNWGQKTLLFITIYHWELPPTQVASHHLTFHFYRFGTPNLNLHLSDDCILGGAYLVAHGS